MIAFTYFYFDLFYISELFTAVNNRMCVVEEEDKECYLRDYLAEMEGARLINIISNQQNGSKFYELSEELIFGVMSKIR